MMFSLAWQGIALALACSIDALAAGFAYGGKGIHIPAKSGLLLSVICTLFLALALFLGGIVGGIIPEWLNTVVHFSVLFILGSFKICESIIKQRPSEGRADRNRDNIISLSEAAVLAVVLSLDGLAVGFGAGVGSANIFVAVTASLALNAAAILGGARLGGKLAKVINHNISWVGGVILLVLAFLGLAN